MAITRQIEKSLITGPAVVAKAKFNKVRWDESDDPRHAFYRLYRYGSEADADDNVNAEVFGPIIETFYKDDDDLAHGEEFWYRASDVDNDGDEGDLSDPASLEARGVQTADVEPAAITPIKLNAEVVGVNSAFSDGPFTLADDARNILVELTMTFEPSAEPIVNRRFSISGIVGSTSTLPTAIARVFVNIDDGSGWLFDVGTYFDHADFKPSSSNVTGSCQSVYSIFMDGAATEMTFGIDVFLPAGESGTLKNAPLLVTHHSTAEA